LSMSEEFWKGAGAVIGIVAVRALYQVFQYPSLEEIDRVANAVVPARGDSSKITVYGFHDDKQPHQQHKKGVTEVSLYVLRVESFLRLIGVPYVKQATIPSTSENPRHKLPYANLQGVMLDDSSRIIDHLKSKFKDPDKDLTDEQRALGCMIRHTIFGSLYWVMYHMSMCSQSARASLLEMMQSIPPILRQAISASVLQGVHSSLDGQGIQRLPKEQVAELGKEMVVSIHQILGSHQFILGTTAPTSYDCDVYSTLVLLFHDGVLGSHPWVVAIQKEYPNLVDYVDRLRLLWFPELKQD